MEFTLGAFVGVMGCIALLFAVSALAGRDDPVAEEAEEYRERGRRDALAALRRAIRSHEEGREAGLQRDLEEGKKALEQAEGKGP